MLLGPVNSLQERDEMFFKSGRVSFQLRTVLFALLAATRGAGDSGEEMVISHCVSVCYNSELPSFM